MLFKKGYTFTYGKLSFEKLDNNNFGLWVCLNSTYVLETKNEKDETIYEVRPESEKPLYKHDGSLNRYGFKWTDKQIKEYYGIYI